jgi:gamma-glutamyltranspeptidase/glutathione hydrolase
MKHSARLNSIAVGIIGSVLGFMPATACHADESVKGVHELVIAGHPASTETGLKVLHAGGNAADALIAVSLSLGVTEPGNSGLGGKMVLLYYDAKTRAVTCVVAMDAGPLHVTSDQLRALPPEKTEKGWSSTCTPGIASALGEIHKRFATRPWAELCAPAIHLAENGVTIIPTAASMFNDFTPNVDAEATRIYAPTGKTLPVGAVFKNPDLARTLHIISDKGPDAFYHGQIPEMIVAACKKGGGYLSLDDFANYHARVLEPLKGSFQGYTVYSSPPPLDGGSILLTSLKCMDKMDWTGASPRNAKYIDTFSRVLQQVYPQTTKSAADVADSDKLVGQILSDSTIAQTVSSAKTADPHAPYGQRSKPPAAKAASLDLKQPLTEGSHTDSISNFTPDACGFADQASSDFQHFSTAILAFSAREAASGGKEKSTAYSCAMSQFTGDDSQRASTTHLVIIDKAGDIVCCTQSLGLHFGADVVATGTGVLMNADVSNFSLNSPKSVNSFAPGKWPRSTMSPTMFFIHDKPHLIIGSPAGARIPNLVAQVSLDVLKFGVPLKQAIEAPRFHIVAGGAQPDAANHIDIEPAMPAGLETSLDALGWKVTRRQQHDFYFGSVNAALLDDTGTIYGVADQRRTSDAGGD